MTSELFEALAENAPDGLAVVDGEGRIVFVNATLERMFGYARSELHGESIEILMPFTRGREHLLRGKLLANAPRPVVADSMSLAGRRSNGVEFPVEVRLTPLPSGREPMVGVTVRDVSEQRRRESELRRAARRLAGELDQRQRAVDALRASETRLRELIEQAPEALFLADIDGYLTDVNRAACELLGYARDELEGKKIVDIIPPEDLERLARTRKALLSPGAVEHAEWKLLAKDGTAVPVEVCAKIHPGGRWQAFVRDIRRRTKAEAAIKHSEEMLARAQRVAHVGSWDWDLRTDRVERSTELHRMFGLSEPALGDRLALAAYIHPDDRARVIETTEEAACTGSAYTLEHRVVRHDGKVLYVLHQGEPVMENGVAVRMVGTLLDITKLKLAEQERERSRAWLETVLDECPVGIILISGAEPVSVRTNRAARALIGREAGAPSTVDFVLRPDETPLPPSELPGVRAAGGERVDWRKLLVRRPTGELVPVLIGAAPILSRNGERLGAVVAMQDISAAEELERLRAEWSSVIAHDLRQPLNSMMLAAQLCAKTELPGSATYEYAERILASGRRLDRMIHDLMDLSQLEASRLRLQVAPCDVVAVVRSSIAEMTLDPATPPVRLRAGEGIPVVDADADRITQIMFNLLSNAVKYGRTGAPVDVEIVRGAHDVSVAVTNEGEGIAPEDLPRLFQRFERVAHRKATAVKGIGLGLHITRGLVEAHGGRMEVTSSPGAATTFRFTLPIAREATA